MAEKELKEHLEKLEKLVYSAKKFENEMSFRMVLEGMVKKGGEDAEYELVRFINDRTLDLSTRLNIIRVTAYIRSTHFLIPLKKIIDKEDNINLKKEAVISVARFNNRQALNILDQALKNIANPILHEVITNEIAKIKKNNPLFTLLPRFKEGEKDPKNFQVTLDILKRILTPRDATLFTAFLTCGKRPIEDGAFEILCFTGDVDAGEPVFKFFRERFEKIPDIDQSPCRELYALTLNIKHYFSRHPSLIDGELETLAAQFLLISDPRVRELYTAIFCRSQHAAALSFTAKIYDSDPALQPVIIREYSGNESAVDLLFDKYYIETANQDLKKEIIQSLLKTRKGLDYFYTHFSTLGEKEKETVVNHLPLSGGADPDLSRFIKMIFQADQLNLKAALLNRAKTHFEFSIKDVLFDPERESEFSLMEEVYLDTITRLFPVTSVKKLLERITYSDLPVSRVRKYLKRTMELAAGEFVFHFQDQHFLPRAFNKIIFYNNPDLNVLFLNILRHIKTFDMKVIKNIEESLSFYAATRGAKIGVKEGNEARKVRIAIKDLLYEIKAVEDGCQSLESMFAREVPDADQMAHLLNRHSLCAALFTHRLCQAIEKSLASVETDGLKQWIDWLRRFPMLGAKVRGAVEEKTQQHKGPLHSQLIKLCQSLPTEPYKIVIQLGDKHLFALISDQCREIIPHIPIDTRVDRRQEGDISICDPGALKDLILRDLLPTKKLFLVLDKRSDFSSFQAYNPHTLVKPFSAFRMMKEILKELYI
jgi:hypothetical protein